MAREMKDSGIPWIGEIPFDWNIVPLKRLCSMQAGKNLISEQIKPSGQYPVYGGNGVRGYFDEFNIDGEYLLVGRQGALCGNVHRVIGKFWATEHAVVTTPSLLANIDFLHYLLIAMDLNQYASNVAAQPGLAVNSILNVKTCLVPFVQQKRIAEFLDKECAEIDTVLAKTRDSIEEYKKLKQAIITQAVTKGIRSDRQVKNSSVAWIGTIPTEWDISALGKFISIDSGISVGKKYGQGTLLVEVPYLRVANVQGDHVDLSDVATIMVTPEEAEKYRLKDGQLLMTEGGDRDKLGRGCLWNGEIENCIHQNHVFAVQTNSRLTVKYLDYLTTSEVARTYFDVTAKKTTNLACTSKSTIQKFTIPIPPVEEQNEICHYLDRQCLKLDTLLASKESIIEQLDRYKKSMIYEYVTGKKEVPQA